MQKQKKHSSRQMVYLLEAQLCFLLGSCTAESLVANRKRTTPNKGAWEVLQKLASGLFYFVSNACQKYLSVPASLPRRVILTWNLITFNCFKTADFVSVLKGYAGLFLMFACIRILRWIGGSLKALRVLLMSKRCMHVVVVAVVV